MLSFCSKMPLTSHSRHDYHLRRYLRSKGFCVVNILDKTWEQMGFEEQVADLASKVQQAQKQPTGKSFVGPSPKTWDDTFLHANIQSVHDRNQSCSKQGFSPQLQILTVFHSFPSFPPVFVLFLSQSMLAKATLPVDNVCICLSFVKKVTGAQGLRVDCIL